MKLIIEIDEEEYLEICNEPCTKLAYRVANGTPIPDNATNGDSVKKMFCKGIVRISSRKNISVEFNKDWWNAPYQKGGKK